MAIKPLEDRIVIKTNEAETTTASGLVIPDTAKEKPQEGTVIAGGVAANSRLRVVAQERCDKAGIGLRVPSPGLCTDNGAMVAALGSLMVSAGREPSPVAFDADSSLPVTTLKL